ncbi:MAG: hypothetical protein Fur0042_20400 [Cyanophyceae cyanobacterium]
MMGVAGLWEIAMSTTALNPQLFAVPSEPIWRLSVAQYRQMVSAGILTEADRVELLDGLLTLKMPKNPPHRLATKLLRTAFEAIAPEGWYVDSQEPITLATSEPEPDLTIVRGDPRDYRDRHPGAADLGLVVEIADATLDRDRGLKKRLYAEAAIPLYWIVSLPDRQLFCYSQPVMTAAGADYQVCETVAAGGRAIAAIAGQVWGEIELSEILP